MEYLIHDEVIDFDWVRWCVLCLLGFYARLNRNMWEDV